MASPLAAFGDIEISRINSETLTGTKTLVDNDKSLQILDPGGANRTVKLPPERFG